MVAQLMVEITVSIVADVVERQENLLTNMEFMALVYLSLMSIWIVFDANF
jgi:hypothetical protein